MSRFAAKALCRAAAILAASAGVATAARADPPEWRVKGPHAEVDLFGSVHLLSDTTRWRTRTLDADLAQARSVWFEIPLSAASQQEAGRLALAQGLLPPGQSLKTLLPPALYARASALAKRENMAPGAIDRLKPWLAELTLSLLYFQHQGARQDLGVESQIDAAAPADAKREAFETVAEQIALFSNDPMAEQIASLKETLDEIDTDPGIFGRLAAAWQRGDVKAIQDEAVEPMKKEDEALYRRLLVDRNRRFATRIEQLVRGEGRVFVVVGIGHLVGPDGVPAMLRKDGLAVSGP